jgi:hypothetical protein
MQIDRVAKYLIFKLQNTKPLLNIFSGFFLMDCKTAILGGNGVFKVVMGSVTVPRTHVRQVKIPSTR